LDTHFPTLNNELAFIKVKPHYDVVEIWPILLEKGYAKLYDGYNEMVGGSVEQALEDLTNGFSERFVLNSERVSEMIETGEFWVNLREWKNKGYLMGASTYTSEEHSISTQGLIQGSIYTI